VDGRPAYCYNLFGLQQFKVVGADPVLAGRHQVRVEFTYDGGGIGKGGSAASERQAVAEANAHCAKSGKVAKVTHEDLGPVTADVYFACVDK